MERIEEEKNIYNLLSSVDFKDKMDYFNDTFRGMYPILRIIKNSKEEVTPGSLAKSLHVSTARIAVMICNLERKKLLVKKKSNTDARKFVIGITNEGTKLIEKCDEVGFDAMRNLLSKLNDEEIIEFEKIINKIYGGCENVETC